LRSSPRTFKVLVTSALIENVAFGLIIPYLTLYMLIDINISEVLTGIVLMTYTISGMPAMILGGMFADKFGRRVVLLASLGLMSITILMYFFAFNFWTLVIIAFFDSFVGSMYMPAANAMIADIIPSGERPRAFSVLRIAWNIGIVAGPVMGAVIVAASSIKVLFVFGSAILAGAFFMNLMFIRETKPADAEEEGITFRRVLKVADDHPFFLLSALSGVFWFFFSQWMSVLPAYAYSDLHIEKFAFGLLFSATALMTVLFQLWVTSKMVKFRRSAVLMAGQLITSAGFAVIFFAWDFYSLLGCIIVITVGELVYMSIVSTIIADLAPADRRGTYMGFSGFVQTLGSGVGFFFGMWLLSSLDDAAWVWPIFGAIGAITSIGYISFSRMVGPEHDKPSQKPSRVDQEPPYHTVRSEGIEKDR